MLSGTRIGVLGAGLIGGSICKSLRSAGIDNIAVFSPSPSTREGVEADGFTVVQSLDELVLSSDVLFVCVPLNAQMDVFHSIAQSVNNTGKSQLIVTDVSSVKGNEAAATRKLFESVGVVFIPGHPMAGTEHSGFSAATDSLFNNATWVLCPRGIEANDWFIVAQLVFAMKAKLSVLDVENHDAIVAAISHVPYVAAASLLAALPDDADQALAYRLAAGSFRDGTRVAASEPWLSASMVTFNKENVVTQVRKLAEIMERLAAEIESGHNDAVQDFFAAAHSRRAHHDAVKSATTVVEVSFPLVSVTRRSIDACQRGALIRDIRIESDFWVLLLEQ